MVQRSFLIVVVLFMLVGCATAPQIHYLYQESPGGFEVIDPLDAAQYVLGRQGFAIASVNPSYQTITSTWKSLNNADENLGLSLLMSSRFSFSSFEDYIKVRIEFSKDSYTVYPQTARVQEVSNALMVTENQSEAQLIRRNSSAETMLLLLVEELNAELGLEGSYQIVDDGTLEAQEPAGGER